ncbi:MAG: cell division protein FtsZ [Candidatus Aenigmatarchaeota archaeon]
MAIKQLTGEPKFSEIDEELRKIVEKRKTRIKVVGCGGAGNNTVSRLMQVGIVGAQTIAINTDAMDLLYTDADVKILIGRELTGGLGAGADPRIGMEAAKESKEELKKVLKDSDMVFVTGGLGGGTGTGSAPVVAEIAKRLGALVIGVFTLPFSLEGKQRWENAMWGLEMLEPVTDTLILIPNDKLLELFPDVSITTAFKIADELLINAIKGITEMITKPGLVNRDFADIKAIMSDGGLALISMGESDSENRAIESVQRALNNPLLSVDISDAKGALVAIFSGPDITLKEVQAILDAVRSKMNSDAKLLWGVQIDKSLGDTVRTLLIITGVSSPQIIGKEEKGKVKKKFKKDIEKELGIEFV